MALRSSGAISLDDLHVEAGGTTGSNCTVNDSDIRDLISKSAGATMSFNEWYGASAVTPSVYSIYALGYVGGYTGNIERIVTASLGNATEFGVLSQTRANFCGGCSDTTRNLFAGGIPSNNVSDTIDYVTAASTGNATSFGNLTHGGKQGINGQVNNTTRGLFYLGRFSNNSIVNDIRFVTIQSTGNDSTFGDLSTARYWLGSASNSTRGIFFGGNSSNVIDYVTISSTGNATDFGDAADTGNSGASGVASSTRAVFNEGNQANARFVYVTIASTGNATDFGVPVFGSGENRVQYASGAANATRGVFFGGDNAVPSNQIQYITIANTGNGNYFGDLNYSGNNIYGIASSGGCSAATGQ